MVDAELAQRIDGVAWVLMALIADLEKRELVDGERFCEALRRTADMRRQAVGLEIAAQVIEEVAGQLDAARQSRQSQARPG